jgi:hypothetical protein
MPIQTRDWAAKLETAPTRPMSRSETTTVVYASQTDTTGTEAKTNMQAAMAICHGCGASAARPRLTT